MDVYFYEAFQEEQAALRKFLPAGWSVGMTTETVQESGDSSPPAKILSLRTQSILPADWAGSIEGILTRSTGYDHVLRYLARTGAAIPCGYLPSYCARAVAEQAILIGWSLLRKLPAQMANLGRFDRDGLTGQECPGRTLLVVGVGNIGSRVVQIGEALGMEVLGVDLVEKHPSVNYIGIDKGLRRADLVVCAMNLTEENPGYFNAERLGTAQPGCVFVNVARGELSPMADLLSLLESGHLGGVGLDVYEQESALAEALRRGGENADAFSTPALRAVGAMMERSDVLLTPHNAFNTHQAVQEKARQSIQQIETFLRTGGFDDPVG